MQIINHTVSRDTLTPMIENYGYGMVKAVVDLNQAIIAVDAELHADLEGYLMSLGSNQYDLWGINLYPDLDGEDFVEFDAILNIRPAQGNRSRGVDSEDVRNAIYQIVDRLLI